MWWRSRFAIALIAIGLTPLVVGCGFRPLYGVSASGIRTSDLMAAVTITTIPGRVGQRIRNELIFDTTGGSGSGAGSSSLYRLDIAIREQVNDQLVRRTGDVTSQVYLLNASFKLIRLSDNAVILQGNSVGRAPFDRVESIFANVRARVDAENRAATTVSDGIKTRVAAFLSIAT